jgi:hypothetical protein
MQITVTRIEAKRYTTEIERSDGVTLRVPGYGFMRPLPHDLGHYVVETTLKLPHGFWGSVAAGAKLAGMVVLRGRQKPHADEQAKAIAKANASQLGEAERLVAGVEKLVEHNLDRDWQLVEAHLKEVMAATSANARILDRCDVRDVCAAWRAMQAQWDAVPIGDCLRIQWGISDRTKKARQRL